MLIKNLVTPLSRGVVRGLLWWLRIGLPMQGTQVKSLVLEDSTCHGATKPISQLLSPHSRACASQLLKPEWLELVLCNKRSHYNEKPVYH